MYLRKKNLLKVVYYVKINNPSRSRVYGLVGGLWGLLGAEKTVSLVYN